MVRLIFDLRFYSEFETGCQVTTSACMKAAVIHEFGKPLSIDEVPKPEPTAGEVVFKTEASGLCHTDIHTANGDLKFKPKLPIVPGHEAVGIVESVGAGVTNIKPGDRVALPWLAFACGECGLCAEGEEQYCEKQLNPGLNMPGGYAEFTKAFARYAGVVPKGMNPFDAAVLSCAGLTSYKAVKTAKVKASDLVAIFGIGGLGHLAVQYAIIAGADVVAVDLQDEKLHHAKELGAKYTINAAKQDPVEEIRKLGGANATLVLAASEKAYQQAYYSLRRCGTMVFVGLLNGSIEIPIITTVAKGVCIRGSIVGSRADLQETYRLHMEGKTRVLYEKRRLDQVNEAFEEVEEGRNKAPRLVFDLT
jgi:alcohol dehydrogenase, propanol-preferring